MPRLNGQGDILGRVSGSESAGLSAEAAGEGGRGGQGSYLPRGSQSALHQCDRHLHVMCPPRLTGLEFPAIST